MAPTTDPGINPALVKAPVSESDPRKQPLRERGWIPDELANRPVGSLAAHDQPADDERGPVTHGDPILTFGAAGPAVEKLARLLAHAGEAYATNTIVNGTNPHNILDNTVMADVRRFRADYDVSEPKDLYQSRDVAADLIDGTWVGPYTWQKLYELAGA